MSLPPGTRIVPHHGIGYSMGYRTGYLQGALLWGPLGLLMGSVVTACALALAWAHMGG